MAVVANRRTVLGGLVLAPLMTSSARCVGAVTAVPSSPDRVAVEGLAHAFVDAWNRHDMHAFANLFHDDAEWVHWRGGLFAGKEAIYQGHKLIHETFYRATTMHFVGIENVRFESEDVAVVRVREDLTGDERSPKERHRYRKTMIATRRNGQWLLSYGHNTRIHEDLT